MRVKLRAHYGSHLPVLMRVMESTWGSVVELGSGAYSTPYLHWECYRSGRRLVTYESVREWYELAKEYGKGKHEVRFVEDWNAVDLSEPWSVAFVDHHPGARRGEDIKRLGHAEFVVVHDAMRKYESAYGYLGAFELFRYRYKYKGAVPWTMVLSNRVDLGGFRV